MPEQTEKDHPVCGVCGERLAPRHLRALMGPLGLDYEFCPGGQPVRPLVVLSPGASS